MNILLLLAIAVLLGTSWGFGLFTKVTDYFANSMVNSLKQASEQLMKPVTRPASQPTTPAQR